MAAGSVTFSVSARIPADLQALEVDVAGDHLGAGGGEQPGGGKTDPLPGGGDQYAFPG